MERESASLCRESASRIEDVARQIFEGSIKIEDLEIILENEEQMKTLCKLIPFSSDVDSRELLQANDVLRRLKTRLEEFQFYRELKVHLGELCNHLKDIDGKQTTCIIVSIDCMESVVVFAGAAQLLSELQNDHGRKEIRRVYQKENGGLRFGLFQGARKLQPMLKPFYVMSVEHNSYTFLIIWEEQMNQAKAKKPTLTIAEIPELVWKPTFAHCQVFLEHLQNRQVKLSDVDKYFEHQKNAANLQRDLQSFSAAIAKCQRQKVSTSWIPGLVDVLQQYWLLCKAKDTAEILISLKDKLKFIPTSHFHLVQALPQQVTVNSSQFLEFYAV